MQFRLGFADPEGAVPYSPQHGFNGSVVNTAAHQQLALEATRQSLVLLKNEKATLPITKSPLGMKVTATVLR